MKRQAAGRRSRRKRAAGRLGFLARRRGLFEPLEDRTLLTVSLEASPLAISEAGGTSTLTARLSQTNTQSVTVNLATTGTATLTTDFTISTTQIVIPAGSLTGQATLTGVTDTVTDNNETVIVAISTVTNDTENGEQSVTVQLSENAGTAELRGFVRLDVDGDGVFDTAEPGIPGVLVNLSGTSTTNQTVTLSALSGDDGRFGFTDLPAGTYSLALQTAAALIAGVPQLGSSGGTISGQTISEIQLSAAEVANGYQFLQATPRPEFVSLRFLSTNRGMISEIYRQIIATGAEQAGDDDLATRIRAGETEDDPPVVSLIGDNRPDVTLSASAATFAEAAGTTTITATLSRTTSDTVTLNLGFAGTALENVDYNHSATQITIAAGQLTGQITLTGVEDTSDEADETVIVNGVSAVGARVSSTTTTVTLVDDDTSAVPTVSLSASTTSLVEEGTGNASVVTATLSRAAETQVTVSLDFTGTATRNVDYQTTAAQIVIPVGQTAGSVTITSRTDTLDEVTESIQVAIGTVVGAQELDSQQVSLLINDNDDSPTVTFTTSSDQLSEAGGLITVTATLSQVSSQQVSVGITFSGTAEFATDYTRSATSIAIPAGQTTGTLTFTAVDDTIDEADETVIVALGTITGASSGGTAAKTHSIIDNDLPRVELTTEKTTLAENGDQSIVRAVLVTSMSQAVTVTLGFTGTATLDGDYQRSATTITIPAGQLNGQVTVTSVQDAIDEANETVIVTISSVTNASTGTNNSVTLTIGDDDAEPTVTLTAIDTDVTEGDATPTTTLTATLSAASGRPVTVALAHSGTAQETADFTLSTDEIVIPAGQTTETATLTVVNDTVDEDDETAIVDIATVENGTESGAQRVTVTINDNDPAPNVVLTVSDTQIDEANDATTVTATLSAASQKEVAVTLAFAGTATNETDYSRSAEQMVFTAGQTTRTMTLTAIQDLVDDNAETIEVSISAATNATDTTPQPLVVTIVDDDATPPPPGAEGEPMEAAVAQQAGLLVPAAVDSAFL